MNTDAKTLLGLLLISGPLLGAGTVSVRLGRGDVVRLTLEEYVGGVLAGEGNSLPLEAQKAVAVAARSWAVANMGRHRREGFDFCESTHCQDFYGRGLSERVRGVVSSVEGELLWFQGSVANAFYSLDCGGQSESYPGAPYLVSQADSYCVSRGRRRWQARLRGVREAAIVERTASGRVKLLRVDGRLVGWEAIEGALSSLFSLNGLVLEGYGAGHGIGLCQAGASARAEAGHGYRQILEFYYSGTRVGLTPQGLSWTRMSSERWELWTVNPGIDGAVLQAAEQGLKRAEDLAGWKLSGPARLRVYPSVAAFRDATGEPGTVAASTLGRTVRLQPAWARIPGVLTHESLHLLVNQRARAGTPAWFMEGLVLCLAREGVTGADPALRAEYQRLNKRVDDLITSYGLGAVTGWLERGLPAGISDKSVTQAATKSR
jgi:stage II sporulation protein D